MLEWGSRGSGASRRKLGLAGDLVSPQCWNLAWVPRHSSPTLWSYRRPRMKFRRGIHRICLCSSRMSWGGFWTRGWRLCPSCLCHRRRRFPKEPSLPNSEPGWLSAVLGCGDCSGMHSSHGWVCRCRWRSGPGDVRNCLRDTFSAEEMVVEQCVLPSNLELPTADNAIHTSLVVGRCLEGIQLSKRGYSSVLDDRVSVDMWGDDFSVDAIQIWWHLTAIDEESGFEEFVTEREVSLRCQKILGDCRLRQGTSDKDYENCQCEFHFDWVTRNNCWAFQVSSPFNTARSNLINFRTGYRPW